jgi:Cysteine-rich secretory protein family
MRSFNLVAFVVAAGCSSWSQPLYNDPFPASQSPPTNRYSQLAATPSEHELFASINDERRAAGLAPLAWSDEVSFVAHDPKMKFDFGKLVYSDIRLDLASSDTPSAAMTYWLGDAKQRANLLSRDATHMGIAIMPDGPDRITAVAIAVRVAPPLAGVDQIKRRIAGALAIDQWGLHRDEWTSMDRTAQVVAEGLAAHKSHRDVYDDYVTSGAGAVFVTSMADTSRLDRDVKLEDLMHRNHNVAGFGVGIAQSPNREHGDGLVYVVVAGCVVCKPF